jgi:putative endonuclease
MDAPISPKTPCPKDVLGRRGEAAAARYLTRQLGWTILDRNWRCRDGELDLVAYDGYRHIACEVKTRSSVAYGAPVEAITTVKAARLRRLAGRWADAHGVCSASIRIDVIGLVATGTDSTADNGVCSTAETTDEDFEGFTVDHLRQVC